MLANNLNIIGQANNNIKNLSVYDETNFEVNSNVKLQHSNNGSINLVLKIPLLNQKYERIKIEFKKKVRI